MAPLQHFFHCCNAVRVLIPLFTAVALWSFWVEIVPGVEFIGHFTLRIRCLPLVDPRPSRQPNCLSLQAELPLTPHSASITQDEGVIWQAEEGLPGKEEILGVGGALDILEHQINCGLHL